MWLEAQEGFGKTWRFVLIDPQTGKPHGFQSLGALFDYLAILTEVKKDDDKNPNQQ